MSVLIFYITGISAIALLTLVLNIDKEWEEKAERFFMSFIFFTILVTISYLLGFYN